ncbi:MAG: hypothetical protein ACD_80C00012G0005 [uncultured bacterium (gcode 4)]|uniref:Uncharacterized protein n=1 Tax=uncultured bacterium (gcode 4) TaxID=1234023 RepID=K1YJT4_9BACT|nr:MAG: hypothetical protein ACD_80C00012G0005 [uncultured bacterium (gcode 4)]
MNIFKKAILIITLAITGGILGGGFTYAVAPSFNANFANYLTDTTPDKYGRVETVFNIGIDRNLSLMDNVKRLFYPSSAAITDANWNTIPAWGNLWTLIRSLWFIILFIFLVMTGVNFIMQAKEADGPKKAFSSLIYILYGAFLVFGVTWILWTVLDIGNLQGSGQLVDRVQNVLFLQILSFFKVLAFFVAIIMLVVSGFRMMAAMDKSDKVAIARKWAINVVIALVFIKVVDYVFYIAQTPAFGTKAADMIVNVAVVLWWVLGSLFVLAIFYAWYLLIASSGKEDAFKKAKWIIVNIFVISLVIFLFLLIVYQVFNEFG